MVEGFLHVYLLLCLCCLFLLERWTRTKPSFSFFHLLTAAFIGLLMAWFILHIQSSPYLNSCYLSSMWTLGGDWLALFHDRLISSPLDVNIERGKVPLIFMAAYISDAPMPLLLLPSIQLSSLLFFFFLFPFRVSREDRFVCPLAHFIT